MKKKIQFTWLGCLLGMYLLTGSTAFAKDSQYEVTITNLTRGQSFTPILVVSHREGVDLFKLGDSASDELAALAEGGDVGPLTMMLEADSRVIDVQNSGGLLAPGDSVTVLVDAKKGAKQISVASMLIPTNDAFFALNAVTAPKGGKSSKSMMYLSPAYDAGSEPNDELCAYIPGPACGGAGPSPGVGGEDYVHIHAGIHGVGDLPSSERDWHNPVARIVIRAK
jgi:hypothetical protein